MKIGLCLDMRNPPAWRRSWVDLYRQAVELVQTVEQLGGDSVWLGEHHFFEDGYLPQPFTLAAAIAAVTSTVRIGTAVVIAPLRPATLLAEEAAIVDLLSDGRFELGLGAGYRVPEYAAYGASPEGRMATTEALALEVRRLLDHGGVTPPPAHHIPIWLGYGGPRGARRAGRCGEGLLSIDPRLAEPYLAGLAEGGHDAAGARMAGLVNVVVADDPERAWGVLGPHFVYQLSSYARYAVEGTEYPVPPVPDAAGLRDAVVAPSAVGVFPHVAILTAEETIALLRRRAGEMPATEAFFWSSFAGMPDEFVQRHVELLCTVVRDGVVDVARTAG